MRKVFLICCFCYQLIANENISLGDPDKGQVYFKYFIAPIVKVNGVVFTKMYTTKEWQERFANNGKRSLDEFKINNKMEDEKFLTHLEAFCIRYAKDSDISPNCGK